MQGPEIAIHVSDEVLEGMNDWCKEHHGKSGLTERVRQSQIELAEAEQQVRSHFISATSSAPGPCHVMSVVSGLRDRHMCEKNTRKGISKI